MKYRHFAILWIIFPLKQAKHRRLKFHRWTISQNQSRSKSKRVGKWMKLWIVSRFIRIIFESSEHEIIVVLNSTKGTSSTKVMSINSFVLSYKNEFIINRALKLYKLLSRIMIFSAHTICLVFVM